MAELAITRSERWAWRFTVMLTLAVVVAVMGLSADSAAVVIGAMLLAPLMTPVLAAAACLSMSLIRKSLVSLLKVALATAWCVAVAYALSWIIPDGPLSGEVEARTRPDIRDLVVALAAGAAGSYATVRRDASAALPGVAVAVALVPPLATIGITLEAAKYDLAIGALLLYVTNLAAIVFAGVMVFIATGFVPPRRLANTAVRLLVAAAVALVVVVAVAVPLYGRSTQVVADVRDEVVAQRVVNDWLAGAPLIPRVDVSDGRVLVRVEGFDPPPDDGSLIETLQAELGEVVVLVEWVRTERATTTTTTPLSENEVLLLQVEPIVDAWLADAGPATDYERDDIAFDGWTVTVDVAGVSEAPSVDDLVSRFESELGQPLAVRLNWTHREAITQTTLPPTELLARRMEQRVEEWAAERGMVLDGFEFDGDRVRMEVLGAVEPDISGIVADLQELADDDIPVHVLYTAQRLVTTTEVPAPAAGSGSLGTIVDPTTTAPAAGSDDGFDTPFGPSMTAGG
jgi:uncharacterized hydrophobic protein (TIGR00271 family)